MLRLVVPSHVAKDPQCKPSGARSHDGLQHPERGITPISSLLTPHLPSSPGEAFRGRVKRRNPNKILENINFFGNINFGSRPLPDSCVSHVFRKLWEWTMHVFNCSDQVHQNPWKSIKHGSTGSPKKVPKTASIECCARSLVPQVMKVCFILVLGHKYETCTLVFYRGVLKKKTVAQSALMPHYSIEKMVSKKTCAPPFYRGCFAGGACTPTIYIYKMGGHQCTPWIHRGIKKRITSVDITATSQDITWHDTSQIATNHI